jgi:adenylate kinase family enzyme
MKKTGNKILIMGASCAGKSTLAENLGKKLNIPVLHLDLYDPYASPAGPEQNVTQKQKKFNL